MTQFEKLLERIRNNPKTVRFDELDRVLIRSGFRRRQPRSGSSHYTYIRGKQILVVPFHKPYVKQIYVERAIELLEGDDRT
ncbi:type II toxin-antitoxin system HicA family toxin [Alicyclobacillus macrosporangiidus]|uniref:type II toxin-antitoxin system HicA family toxin n=1 Tax=Alicyclobacillus macrosporangiidus TaxID=392015 RepID=UPI0005545285|nr:type II toxin-antitoxin system HicA family toxin [Alicyclobacillus macrosporangiidus]